MTGFSAASYGKSEANRRHAHRTRGLSIVSRCNASFNGGTGTVATGGTIAITARVRHQNLTGKTLVSATPIYTHWGPAASTEAATANQIQVKAGIEFEGTVSDQTTVAPITMVFGASVLSTIERRGVLMPDEVPCWVAPSSYIYVRTALTAPANSDTYSRSQIQQGGTSAYGQSTGEGLDSSDKALSGTVTNSALSSFTEAGLMGRTLDGSIAPSITFLGDSIAVGTDDAYHNPNNGGWPFRAFASYPGFNVAIAGEKLAQAVLSTNFQARNKLAMWSTHVLCQYGRNDIQASTTLAVFKANVLAFAYKFMARGQNFVQGTIPPAPTSSDCWLTVTNQTKETGDALRLTYNAWIRDTSASGFVAQANAQVATIPYAGLAIYCDPCLMIECNSAGVLTQNGGYVLAASTTYVTSQATSGTSTSITTSTAAWATNEHKGRTLHTTGGTGSGQARTIGYNTSTVLTVGYTFSPTPDSTTTYKITDSSGMNGVHTTTPGHVRCAAGIDADAIMSRGI